MDPTMRHQKGIRKVPPLNSACFCNRARLSLIRTFLEETYIPTAPTTTHTKSLLNRRFQFLIEESYTQNKQH